MNIVFKEWLPDQPALGNPGLIRAENVLPAYGSYKQFSPLTPVRAGSFTLPALARGGFVAELPYPTSPAYEYYAATNSNLYVANAAVGSGTFNSIATGLTTMSPINEARFAQFDDKVFVARGIDGIQYRTAGSASNFATVPGLTGLRDGRYVAVVGRFLVVANLGSATTRSSVLEWSSIDNPIDFPTPSSTSAIASQSGEQILNIADGPIVGLYGSDQHAIIKQTGAITRMTYVGPPVVFQFDRINAVTGQQRRYGSAFDGTNSYFHAHDGFYKTDGVSVAPIGAGQVDKTFLSLFGADISQGATTAQGIVDTAFDRTNRCILWSYPESAATTANRIAVFNIDEGRWSYCQQEMRSFIEPSPASQADGLYAFNTSNVLCKFSGTAGTAVLETGDMEFNEGGRSYLDSWKPNVESTGTAPAVTGRIGYRDDLSTTSSYTSTTSAFARTGVMNARVDAKYMRIETQIVGNFTKAVSVECDPQPSSMA